MTLEPLALLVRGAPGPDLALGLTAQTDDRFVVVGEPTGGPYLRLSPGDIPMAHLVETVNAARAGGADAVVALARWVPTEETRVLGRRGRVRSGLPVAAPQHVRWQGARRARWVVDAAAVAWLGAGAPTAPEVLEDLLVLRTSPEPPLEGELGPDGSGLARERWVSEVRGASGPWQESHLDDEAARSYRRRHRSGMTEVEVLNAAIADPVWRLWHRVRGLAVQQERSTDLDRTAALDAFAELTATRSWRLTHPLG